jgi:lipid-binding SYLF domain-containing protein
MKLRKLSALALVSVLVISTTTPTLANQQRAIDGVQAATRVFVSDQTSPDNYIPPQVLENAVAIAIIPDVIRAGFILGGTRGTGVLSVRDERGEWSNPAFVTMTAGSIGLQVGAQSSDVIMVFNTKRSLEKALAQDFRLGGSVSGAAGPTGAAPVTTSSTVPDVYTYVRSRNGLFGGVSLEGTRLEMDSSRNAEFYANPGVTPEEIFRESLKAPEAAADLRSNLNKFAPRRK